MSSEGGRPKPLGYLPEDAQRCVWMAAGLVAYKLCDLEFDCDSCPFDGVIRRQRPAPAGVGRMQRPARPRPTEFPEDRRYHAGHTWARFAGADGRGPLRVGLDAFAAWLVADASAAILPQPGTAVACGGPGLWVVDGVAPVAFAMPASGVASRANPLLRTAPRLVVEEPYDAGWLLEVECAAPAAALVALQPAPAMAARAESLAREFAASALAQARRARECVGAALPDGGEPAADWRSVLGPRAYHALVQRFLAERSAGRRAATPP